MIGQLDGYLIRREVESGGGGLKSCWHRDLGRAAVLDGYLIGRLDQGRLVWPPGESGIAG